MNDRVVAVLSTCCDAARAANWRRRVAADTVDNNAMHEGPVLVNAGMHDHEIAFFVVFPKPSYRIKLRQSSARQHLHALAGEKGLLPAGSEAGGKNRMAAVERAVVRRPVRTYASQNPPRLASWRAPERSLGKRASTSVAERACFAVGR